MTFLIRTVIVVEGLFCGIFQAEDRPMVHCEASAVHFGGEGQVTCHYPMDLSQNDYAVSIEQFGDESEMTVLDCVWDGIRQCDNVRQGYRITNITGNTLTVTIPKVTDEHMGRYGCALFDKETSYASDLCTFEVKDRKSRCEASVENIGGRGQVTCHYPMDLTGVHCVVDIGQFVDGAETHILSCMWEDITQHECTDIRQGYMITNFTGNTLTVTIPEVTDEHRGRYRCSLVDEIIHDYEFCDVVVKRVISQSDQPQYAMEGEANNHPGVISQSDQPQYAMEGEANNYPGVISQSDQQQYAMEGEANNYPGSDKGTPGGGIAGIVIGVLLPIAALAVAVLVCRYRRKGNQSRENKEMTEMTECQDAAPDPEAANNTNPSCLPHQESRLKPEGKEEEHEGLLASSVDPANRDKNM